MVMRLGRLALRAASGATQPWPASAIAAQELTNGLHRGLSATGKGRRKGGPSTPGNKPLDDKPKQSPLSEGAGGASSDGRSADGQDDDDNAPSTSGRAATTVHTHFANMGTMNKWQPVLERAEVHKAADGLLDSRWPWMVDSPFQRLWSMASRPLVALRTAALSRIYARLAFVSEAMISEEVDEEFVAEEFLEGVEGAVAAVMDNYAAQDVDALRGMASDAMVKVLTQAHSVMSEGGLQLKAVSTTVRRAALAGVNLWGPDSIALFDKGWLEKMDDSTCKSWLVVSVSLDARFESEFDAPSIGKEGVRAVVDRRGTWLFVRGPLPPGRSRVLHSKWFVLGWW